MKRGLYTHAAAFLAWPFSQWLAARLGDRLHITHGRFHS